MAFGLFHLHRIWGLIDRNAYARFWINTLTNKGLFYFVLMSVLAVLCIWGIITFAKIGITITGGDGSIYLVAFMCCSIYLLLWSG